MQNDVAATATLPLLHAKQQFETWRGLQAASTQSGEPASAQTSLKRQWTSGAVLLWGVWPWLWQRYAFVSAGQISQWRSAPTSLFLQPGDGGARRWENPLYLACVWTHILDRHLADSR